MEEPGPRKMDNVSGRGASRLWRLFCFFASFFLSLFICLFIPLFLHLFVTMEMGSPGPLRSLRLNSVSQVSTTVTETSTVNENLGHCESQKYISSFRLILIACFVKMMGC